MPNVTKANVIRAFFLSKLIDEILSLTVLTYNVISYDFVSWNNKFLLMS